MARQKKTVTSPFGRDKGKTFTIEEMDAFSCEDWGRDAVSAVYRCSLPGDQGVLAMISEGIRAAFMRPEVPDLALPSDGSLTKDSPQYKQAQQDAQEEAEREKELDRESAPTQMAAILGIRLFLSLPYAEQKSVLDPLLACVSFEAFGKAHPIVDGGVITAPARAYIEEPRTIAWLKSEAFKMHTDFFTPAVHSIYNQITEAALRQMQPSETSLPQ